MKKVKGMYEAVLKHCPSIGNDIEKAKFKILHGKVTDNLEFKEELFQKNAFINCKDYRYYYEMGYSVPAIGLGGYTHNDKIDICDSTEIESVLISLGDICLEDDYAKLVKNINRTIRPSARQVYKSDSLEIIYTRKRDSLGVIVGVSGDNILFIFGLHDSNNLDHLDFSNENDIIIEVLDDRIQFKFTIEDGVSFECYLEGERYDLKLGK